MAVGQALAKSRAVYDVSQYRWGRIVGSPVDIIQTMYQSARDEAGG